MTRIAVIENTGGSKSTHPLDKRHWMQALYTTSMLC